MPSPYQGPPVLIIGAGVSGLALAHGLKKHGIPFELFEKDPSPNSRTQGYRVRVGDEALRGLEYLLSSEMMETFNLSCAQFVFKPAMPQIDAHTAEVEVAKVGEDEKKRQAEGRTVDRTVFRDVLLKGLDACKREVHFGAAFDRYEVDQPSGLVTAFFKNGSSATGCLLVGADGKNSGVRKHFLPGQRQLDTGGRAIYGKTELTPELRATVPAEILHGMTAIKDLDDERGMLSCVMEAVVFPHREEMRERGVELPLDYLFWSIASQPERLGFSNERSKTPKLTIQEAEELARQVTEDWHPSLRPIFTQQKEDYSCLLSIRSVEAKGFLVRTPETPKTVVLIGDACHTMSPAGSGALTALRDAFHLCRMIAEDGIHSTLAEKYEAKMVGYASKNIELSWLGVKAIFGVEGEQKGNISEVMKDLIQKRLANHEDEAKEEASSRSS